MSTADKEALARFEFPGLASEKDPDVLVTGSGDATTALLSLLSKTEGGQDAEYIRWHLFDHLPEQYRVSGVRNGQRWVSTPACRAARLAQSPPFDVADLMVQYLFAEPAGEALRAFSALGVALTTHGRRPALVQERIGTFCYDIVERLANSRGVLGAHVLPWYPSIGVFLTIDTCETGDHAARSEALKELVETEGVVGAWRYVGTQRKLGAYVSDPKQSATVYYLYDDPVAVAGRLKDGIERDWRRSNAEGLFAAPFYVAQPHDIERYLP